MTKPTKKRIPKATPAKPIDWSKSPRIPRSAKAREEFIKALAEATLKHEPAAAKYLLENRVTLGEVIAPMMMSADPRGMTNSQLGAVISGFAQGMSSRAVPFGTSREDRVKLKAVQAIAPVLLEAASRLSGSCSH